MKRCPIFCNVAKVPLQIKWLNRAGFAVLQVFIEGEGSAKSPGYTRKYTPPITFCKGEPMTTKHTLITLTLAIVAWVILRTLGASFDLSAVIDLFNDEEFSEAWEAE